MRYLRNRNSINRTAKYHAWIVTRCMCEELIAQMIADEAIRKARDSSRSRLSANPNEKRARDDDHHVPLTSYVELEADRLTCACDAAIHRRIARGRVFQAGPFKKILKYERHRDERPPWLRDYATGASSSGPRPHWHALKGRRIALGESSAHLGGNTRHMHHAPGRLVAVRDRSRSASGGGANGVQNSERHLGSGAGIRVSFSVSSAVRGGADGAP